MSSMISYLFQNICKFLLNLNFNLTLVGNSLIHQNSKD